MKAWGLRLEAWGLRKDSRTRTRTRTRTRSRTRSRFVSTLCCFLLAAALSAGCASPPAYVEADSFYFLNRPSEVLARYAPAEKDHQANALVGIDKMLSAAILEGDWNNAERLAEMASIRVNVFLSGEKGERDALSLLGQEKDKPFKGEPYERAMADFYFGLLRYRRGEYEGALNAFLSAMNKVRGTYQLPVEREKAKKGSANAETVLFENRYSTFAFFAASSLQHIDEAEEARRFLEMAKQARPEMAALFDQGMDPQTNVVAVIEAGLAPVKRQRGDRRQILAYSRGLSATVESVRIAGQPMSFGVSEDLFAQATTLGGRAVDKLNDLKATRQEALQAAGYFTAVAGTIVAFAGSANHNQNLQMAGLAALAVGVGTMIFAEAAIDPSADIRAWNTLPDQIYLAFGRAEPGTHPVDIQAQNQFSGDLSQHWTDVPISKDTTLLWFRLLPYRKGGVYPTGGSRPGPPAVPEGLPDAADRQPRT